MIDGAMYELFESPPMSRTPGCIAVVSGDAIGVEPAGMNEPLCRKRSGDDLQYKALTAEELAAVIESNHNRVLTLYSSGRYPHPYP